MRVLIVGGLGYIGSELIEHYKHRGDNDTKVDILDKQFVPYLVAGLPENFHFVRGDMKDDSAIGPLLEKQPDIIYLLAAEVHAESSIHRERAIWENNFEAMVKVIEKCPQKSRLIFPSTGNVFGGVDESEKHMDLSEEDKPKPKYPYAESKYAVEKHLLNSDKDFIICRFGTNYGYAPGIRFDLVTNNFVKRALTGQTIAVHGKGEHFRPTVCVHDAVRAMIFLSGKKEAKGEIYHVVCENFKIKDLAQKVSSTNPSAKIEYIAEEITFSSYSLSNRKIKEFGFAFEWNLGRALQDMVDRFISLASSIVSKKAKT